MRLKLFFSSPMLKCHHISCEDTAFEQAVEYLNIKYLVSGNVKGVFVWVTAKVSNFNNKDCLCQMKRNW